MTTVAQLQPGAVTRLRDRQEHVDLIRSSEVSLSEIRWLWPGWLARSKLHLLAGDAGTGKTTIAVAIAAAISAGRVWPDGSDAPVGNVLIWSGEDDPSDTIVPRLAAAGADLERVYIVGDVRNGEATRPFDPAHDIEKLTAEAQRMGHIALVIVDPVVSTVAGDSHKNTEVRRSLQPLVDLAGHLDAAVLGISHFSKMGTGGDPLLRVTGSVAFGAVARVVWVAAKRKEAEDRVLARAKSNIGPDEGGYAYRIAMSHGAFSASTVAWGERLDGAARDLLADDLALPPGCGETVGHWLQTLLEKGPASASSIRADAEQRGFRWRTVERAKQALGIRSMKDAPDGGWRWSLPAVQDRQDRRCVDGGVDGLGPPRTAETTKEAP